MFTPKRNNRFSRLLFPLVLNLLLTAGGFAQLIDKDSLVASAGNRETESPKALVASVLPRYYSAQEGVAPADLIERALVSNGELVAVRFDIERARARLQQARIRPNPALEIEQTSGRLVGSAGEGELSVGASLPIELYGRRRSRIEVAEIEIRAREAEVANFERRVAADVLTSYAEALAALREMEVLEMILELDLQTTRFVQIRVNEGETPPLELNLLQVEVERVRARRELVEGRVQSALTRLKLLTNTPFDTPLRLREQMATAVLPALPLTADSAVEIALKSRPDILLAQIEEQAAAAGLRVIRAQSRPDLTATARYNQGRSIVDLPAGVFPQRDRSLTFGVAIGLPIFNRNQGAKKEAEIAIEQARARREFTEKVVRSEVTGAFQRMRAASRALAILETGVVRRSEENLNVFREVYAIGEIRITELVAEQRRLLDANRDLTEAFTERYRAQAELLTALGTSRLR